MGKYNKLLQRILSGTSNNNISFTDLRNLLIRLDFEERVRGDHHIFSKGEVDEIINIQPLNKKAKCYQVKQVRDILIKYQMGAGDV